jgi:two-component system KDP operon response regulator KdpE
MSDPAILIIDDELLIRKMLRITLESNDYKVIESENAKHGMQLAASHVPDLILLDLGLPDENGYTVLKHLREWYIKPIIIISVQADESNIIYALDNGANDYLTKPFRSGELLARIRAAVRSLNPVSANSIMNYGDLEIDYSLHTVKKQNEFVRLTATEFELLLLFARNEGRVLTHDYLLKNIWGPGHTDQAQYLRVFIAQLRKKIETNIDKPKHIVTESGVGYRFTG